MTLDITVPNEWVDMVCDRCDMERDGVMCGPASMLGRKCPYPTVPNPDASVGGSIATNACGGRLIRLGGWT